MVTYPAASWSLMVALAAAGPAEPLIERLDPPRRAAVLMAILGLVLLGLTLVACVMIGGRWLRRVARHQLGPTRNTSHVENRRLRAALEPILPADAMDEPGGAGETAIVRRQSDETVSDA